MNPHIRNHITTTWLLLLFVGSLSGCAPFLSEGKIDDDDFWKPNSDAQLSDGDKKYRNALNALDKNPPKWRIGDWWEYNDGYKLSVTKVDSEKQLTTFKRIDKDMVSNYTSTVQRRGLIKEQSISPAGIKRTVIYRSQDLFARLYPLHVGKFIPFQREYVKQYYPNTEKEHIIIHHKTSWNVLDVQRVQVPAGIFDCWVLEWKSFNRASRWNGFERWYYSPDIRHYVRLEYQYGKKKGARVLTKFGPKKHFESKYAFFRKHI
ncbi:hypothetical protein ACQZV8_11475 [Magnetococcales bacterium HHB-1]